jgi:hypothetical protein
MRPSPPSSGPTAAPYPVPLSRPRPGPERPRPQLRPLASPSTPHPRATSALRLWAGPSSTGGQPMDGSAAPSRASAPALPSRTSWLTPGRPRPCAASPTRCSTPPLTATAGCCSPLPPPQGLNVPPLRGALRRAVTPGHNFEFGRWPVTAQGDLSRPGRPKPPLLGSLGAALLGAQTDVMKGNVYNQPRASGEQ